MVSFLFGNELFKSELKKANAIKELRDIVSDIIICVNYLSLDVFDICKRVFLSRTVNEYSGFLNISGGDFPLLWQKACEASLTSVNDGDRTVFSEIGSVLGAYDSESQLKKLELIEKTLDESYSAKCRKLNSVKKLYRVISLGFGAVICLALA